MFPKSSRNFGQKCAITGQIKARIFDFQSRNERICKPGHVVRRRLPNFYHCIGWCLWRVRSFRHGRIFDLNEFEATLSTAGTVQSESLASCARWLCCIALKLGQHSNLLYSLNSGRTFFFCFRQASHPRPEGTPGIVLRSKTLETLEFANHLKV